MMVVLAFGGLESANGQNTNSHASQQTTSDEATKLTPAAVFERFRSLGKHKDWASMFDMLDKSYKATAEAELRAIASALVAEPAGGKHFKEMNGLELFSYFMERADFERPIVVDEAISGERATVKSVVAGNGDFQLQDIKLIKSDHRWKFVQMWTMQDPLKLPAEPTISPTSIYKAFLVYRERKDWEAMYCMIEEDSRDRMVSGLKGELMKFATTADLREKIEKMDGASLWAKIFASGQMHPVKITSENVNGLDATLTTETLKDGELVKNEVSLIWKNGVWRVLFD